jgi:hypothetical protein
MGLPAGWIDAEAWTGGFTSITAASSIRAVPALPHRIGDPRRTAPAICGLARLQSLLVTSEADDDPCLTLRLAVATLGAHPSSSRATAGGVVYPLAS